jgi:DNA helicase-2/ATP-dependent DNA helicase PcrA
LKEEGTEEAQERIENVKEFVSAVAEFEERTQGTLEDFLQQVSLLSDIDEVESVKNAVMLMTIHSAKGLEFPVVFVTGLEEGLFPVSSSNGSLEESEEERRLFYVATTRAKEKLYLSYCLIRRRFGEIMPQIKSRFLKEIEESALSQGIIEISRKNVSTYLFPEKESNKNGRKNRRKKTSVVHYHDKNSDDVFGDIQAGVKVVHNVFGKGKVISTQGKGENKRAVIIFDEVGTKTIVLKYAKMQVFEIEN